jgi:hypothetical protein
MSIQAASLLVLSTLMLIVWSCYQVLWYDEFGFGLLWIDRTSSFSKLLHIELTAPLSFDPMGYNAILYGIIHWIGDGAFEMRLPSIVGYLLMQACLYVVVRRIVTERAALVALVFPVLTGITMYAVQARPYGLLLGLAGLILLSWQTASRELPLRKLALVTLALSLILAVNTQYYAVLLFVPICLAELVRFFERRRFDVPMLLSISVGLAGIAAAVPFAKALSPFRSNHDDSKVSVHFISHSYLWLFAGYAKISLLAQHLIGLSILLVFILTALSFARYHARLVMHLPYAELVYLVVLAIFPVLAYLLARFVTHFVEARYIQPAILGITTLFAIFLAPLLSIKRAGSIMLTLVFLAFGYVSVVRVRQAVDAHKYFAGLLAPSSALERNLKTYPNAPLYSTNHLLYEFIYYYSPSADIRSRITLIHPRKGDLSAGVGSDISAQMENMEAVGVPQVVSYQEVATPGSNRLFLLNYAPFDWENAALAESHAKLTHLGASYFGDLTLAQFPPAEQKPPQAFTKSHP